MPTSARPRRRGPDLFRIMGNDTIAAISTAAGPAGIAIVRISGPDSFAIAGKITGLAPETSNLEARFAHFRDPATGERIDEGIVLFFKAPHSYTGEDVAELQGHGGRLPASRLLRLATDAGARPAAPGEFTKRAFLSGRIDLARAEAVMDLIGAASDRAATAAYEQLEGRLSSQVDSAYEEIVSVAADVEHLLDFDENEIDASFAGEAARKCDAIRARLDALASSWRLGSLLRDGALVVLCGKPNAGKSSLLNALLGRDRAIVSPEAGTTRDSIEEPFSVCGIPVRLVDTAGMRASGNGIEAEGVARAKTLAGRADVAVEVIDATGGDFAAAAAAAIAAGRIVALNKIDLAPGAGEAFADERDVVGVSAKCGTGLDALAARIAARLDVSPAAESGAAVSERHRDALRSSAARIADAAAALREGDSGLVAAAENLALAAQAIGLVTGRVWSDDLLDSVFGKFCVGK